MTFKKITFCEKECEKGIKIAVIKCVIARTEGREGMRSNKWLR